MPSSRCLRTLSSGVLIGHLFAHQTTFDLRGVRIITGQDRLFVPKDNDLQRSLLEIHGVKGTCGPSVIAALSKGEVGEIISDWPRRYRGYAHVSEMAKMLRRMGYRTNVQNDIRMKRFPAPASGTAILKIQWLQPDGSEYPRDRIKHAHYLLLQRIDNEWWLFCNAYKWFPIDSEHARQILKIGYVKSCITIENGRRQELAKSLRKSS